MLRKPHTNSTSGFSNESITKHWTKWTLHMISWFVFQWLIIKMHSTIGFYLWARDWIDSIELKCLLANYEIWKEKQQQFTLSLRKIAIKIACTWLFPLINCGVQIVTVTLTVTNRIMISEHVFPLSQTD